MPADEVKSFFVSTWKQIICINLNDTEIYLICMFHVLMKIVVLVGIAMNEEHIIVHS